MVIELIKQAAREGGTVVRGYFGKKIDVATKSNIHDVVTVADKESQAKIVSFIRQEAPNYKIESVGFIGEEDQMAEQGEYMFVIDPIDGTGNFAAGYPNFCISIGVMKDNVPYAGVIYDVMTDTMYSAEKGKGAYMNDERITIPEVSLQTSLLLATFPSHPERRKKGLAALGEINHTVRTIRILGAVACDLFRVASGVGNIVMSFSCNIWDIAAGVVIIEEAGGVVCDFKGNPLNYDVKDLHKYQLLAGNKKLLQEFVSVNAEILRGIA